MGLLTDKNVILTGSDAKEMIVRDWWKDSKPRVNLHEMNEKDNIKFIPPGDDNDPVLVNVDDHHISREQGLFDVLPIGQQDPMYKHFRVNEASFFRFDDRKTSMQELDGILDTWDRFTEIPAHTVPLVCSEIRMAIKTEYPFNPIFSSFRTTLGKKLVRNSYNTVNIQDWTRKIPERHVTDCQIASNILIKAMSNTMIMIPNINLRFKDLSRFEGFIVENISGDRDTFIKLSVIGDPDELGGCFDGLMQDPLGWCEAHEEEGRKYLGWANVLEIREIYYQKRILVYNPWDKNRIAAKNNFREEYACNNPITDRNLLFRRTR